MVLTALSALARSGVDPWDEADRLSQLPRETATANLTSVISKLPNGRWAPSTTGNIAARLIALLPAKRDPETRAKPSGPAMNPLSGRMVMFALIFLVNAVVFSVLRNHEPQPSLEQSASTSASSTIAPPPVPQVDSK